MCSISDLHILEETGSRVASIGNPAMERLTTISESGGGSGLCLWQQPGFSQNECGPDM